MGGVDLIGAGAVTLLDGLDQLSAGASKLEAGTGQLSSGATQLSDGTTQLSDGANTLATGLGDAAAGSGLLAAGISTATDYGLKYAVIVAGADRARTEAMAYGAPVDATGTTAYSLEISGASADVGMSMGRLLGALTLFGLGAGLILFRRRSV